MAFQQFVDSNWEAVAAIYEDRHLLWGVAPGARIVKRSLSVRRAKVSHVAFGTSKYLTPLPFIYGPLVIPVAIPSASKHDIFHESLNCASNFTAFQIIDLLTALYLFLSTVLVRSLSCAVCVYFKVSMCCPAGPAGAQGLAGGGEPDAGGPGLPGAPPAAARAEGQRGSLLAAGHPDRPLAGPRLQGHQAEPAAQEEA